jgi:hypothetical protein
MVKMSRNGHVATQTGFKLIQRLVYSAASDFPPGYVSQEGGRPRVETLKWL